MSDHPTAVPELPPHHCYGEPVWDNTGRWYKCLPDCPACKRHEEIAAAWNTRTEDRP